MGLEKNNKIQTLLTVFIKFYFKRVSGAPSSLAASFCLPQLYCLIGSKKKQKKPYIYIYIYMKKEEEKCKYSNVEV